MKVSELIEELNKFPLDMEVCVYADHGQCSMRVNSIEEIKVYAPDSNDYMMDAKHPDDIDEEEEYVSFCEIGGL